MSSEVRGCVFNSNWLACTPILLLKLRDEAGREGEQFNAEEHYIVFGTCAVQDARYHACRNVYRQHHKRLYPGVITAAANTTSRQPVTLVLSHHFAQYILAI